MRYERFDLGDFPLQKGAVLPDAQLAYLTFGELNEARDNVVVCPSWFTASPAQVAQWMTGPGRTLDPQRWFIVCTSHLGAGVSSSPSNTPAPFDKARFPRVTTYDSVTAQQRLVTEGLGIDRVRLVSSWSMGAQQAYAWAALYPDLVEALGPINGSAKTAHYNKTFLAANMRAIRNAPGFDSGFYERPPIDGLRTFAANYSGWAFSEAFYREELFRLFGATDVESFIELFWEQLFVTSDANDLLTQLWTWWHNDLGDHPTFGGDVDAALGAIRARTIIIQSSTDRYFPPVDSHQEASKIPGARVQEIDTVWGHMAPFNPADQQVIDAALAELLEPA